MLRTPRLVLDDETPAEAFARQATNVLDFEAYKLVNPLTFRLRDRKDVEKTILMVLRNWEIRPVTLREEQEGRQQ